MLKKCVEVEDKTPALISKVHN